ncbi:hypothetical protein CsSME_00013542 [Camellia sinensis var. sinensis]
MALHTVQVRSVEDGFQGSWHSGTVIACENQARRVQYDHLLCDDGLQPLIDCIKVPPVIDGIVPAIRFRIDALRITQDWDEFTDEWKLRGNWLFLELVEEFEQEWPLQVSVRQIWYEVRVKKAFQNLVEWTSTLKGDLAQDAHGLPPSSKTHLDVISRPEARVCNLTKNLIVF